MLNCVCAGLHGVFRSVCYDCVQDFRVQVELYVMTVSVCYDCAGFHGAVRSQEGSLPLHPTTQQNLHQRQNSRGAPVAVPCPRVGAPMGGSHSPSV